MNWLDAVIIIVVLWFTVTAFSAGFIRETVTIFAAILGVVLAGIFYKDLADDVLQFIDNEEVAKISAFAAIFVATAVAGQLGAMLLKPTVSVLQLGIVDQLAGAAFGFAKAMIFVEIFLIVFVTYDQLGLRETIDESFFGSFIVEGIPVLLRILPGEFETAVDAF
jgi:membrane protein required for colicin V production